MTMGLEYGESSPGGIRIEELNVYPNPFDDVIYVSNIWISCRVRDPNGRVVVERTTSAVIRRNYLSEGTYLPTGW